MRLYCQLSVRQTPHAGENAIMQGEPTISAKNRNRFIQGIQRRLLHLRQQIKRRLQMQRRTDVFADNEPATARMLRHLYPYASSAGQMPYRTDHVLCSGKSLELGFKPGVELPLLR